MNKLQLINDDKFKIGFEFEFIVSDFMHLAGDEFFANLKMSDLVYQDLPTSFHLTKKRRREVDAYLNYSYVCSNPDNDYHDSPSEVNRIGAGVLIVLFKLKPKWGWFTIKGNDKTDYINGLIDAVDPMNAKEVSTVAKKLNYYRVRTFVLERHGYLSSASENFLKTLVAKHMEPVVGNLPVLTSDFSDDPKKKPGWYIAEESIDDINEDYYDESGIELITPPLPPREALSKCKAILEAFKHTPFGMRAGTDCGIHVNISHEDLKVEEVNHVTFALMFDEKKELKRFGRLSHNSSAPVIGLIKKIIRKLTRDKIITLGSLCSEDSLRRLIRLVDATLDDVGYNSIRLSKMAEFNYVEYRMAGGKKYFDRYYDIEDHVFKLMDMTMDFMGDVHHLVINQIEDIMIEAGASMDDEPSFLEQISEDFVECPVNGVKSRRYREDHAADLLKMRN